MNRHDKEQSDDPIKSEIGNFFWYVLILTTFACLSDWFAPESLVSESFTIMAVAIGWFYVLLDSLAVRRKNRQRREEHLKNKKRGQSNEKS